jgi:capsular polysaccharide biosynthesis protein
MKKKPTPGATSMPEHMAADSIVDTGSIEPGPTGDRSTTAIESAVTKTRPTRVRKLRAKGPVSPKVNPDRPTLRLKAASAPWKPSSELNYSLGTEAPAIEDEAFKLASASEPGSLAEHSASPQQIEIPELRPSPRAEFDEGHDVAPDGVVQDAASASFSIATPSEDPSQANGHSPVEPAGVAGEDLIAGGPPSEPQIESVDLQARQEAPDASEPLVRHEQINTDSEPPAGDRVHWPSPIPDNDARFTYVPRPDGWQLPVEERLDRQADVAEPDPVEARSYERPEAPVESNAVPRKLPKFSLRMQLVILALAPILVGSLIAFVVASLSPTLFAARSEIVVNVATMDWSRAERFLATQLVIAKARTTLEPISVANKIPLRDLQRDVKVELIGSSDVIAIQYANSDPALALDVVKALTAQYLLNLRDYEQVGNDGHRLLMPATQLEDPVSLKPSYAALIGAIVGVAIGMAGIILRTQAWRMK